MGNGWVRFQNFNCEPFVSVCVYSCVCFLHPKVSLLFDNNGTVCFAMVMAIWGEFCAGFATATVTKHVLRRFTSRVIQADLMGRILQRQIKNEINKEVGLQGRRPAPLSFRPNVFGCAISSALDIFLRFVFECLLVVFPETSSAKEMPHHRAKKKPTCPFYPHPYQPRPSGYGGGQPPVHMRILKV